MFAASTSVASTTAAWNFAAWTSVACPVCVRGVSAQVVRVFSRSSRPCFVQHQYCRRRDCDLPSVRPGDAGVGVDFCGFFPR